MVDNEFSIIINNCNIVDVVSEYIDVIKKGRNFWAICPFHSDNEPSLSISNEKQIFKCFSCGVGGNAITFVRDISNTTFLEAAKKVCEIINFDSPILKRSSQRKVTYSDKENTIFAINKKAMDFLGLLLESKKGLPAIDYLEHRKIDHKTMKLFNIGLILDGQDLIKFLELNKSSQLDLIESGLVNERNNKLSSFFTNRIIFPITNEHNKIVGFSGRVFLENDQRAKYQNSMENLVFKKSKILYNYYNCINDLSSSKKIILVEGFMDVIALNHLGIKNVVATMGTNLSEYQINLIKKRTKNVVLFFDGDQAGKNASLKSALELKRHNLNVFLVKPQQDLDVAEVMNKWGEEKTRQIVANAKDILQFILDEILPTINVNQIEEVMTLSKYAQRIINYERNQDRKNIFINALKKELNINLKNQQVQKKPSPYLGASKEKRQERFLANRYSPIQKAEYEILKRLMFSKAAVSLYLKDLGFLPNNARNSLANFIITYHEKNETFKPHDFINIIAGNKALEDEYNEILYIKKIPFDTKEFISYIKKIKNNSYNYKIEKLVKEREKQSDEIKKAQITKKIIDIKRKMEQKKN